MKHGHGPAEFPGTNSGLRSAKLLSHMRARHPGMLREQLDLNGYEAERVSHTWLHDVHHAAHEEQDAPGVPMMVDRRSDVACLRRAVLVVRKYKGGLTSLIATLEDVARQIEEM